MKTRTAFAEVQICDCEMTATNVIILAVLALYFESNSVFRDGLLEADRAL